MATDPTLAAARRAVTRAGFGQPVTTSAETVEVVYPRATASGRRRRLSDALHVEGLDAHPTVNGENDRFAVEPR